MPKGGAAPDERELRRLALAVRMYQEGRPHWELPAGERHSRVWEWVWCAAEWALWMLLLLWDLLSRGPPLPERAPPRAAPHPTPPPPPHTSHRPRRPDTYNMRAPRCLPTPRSSPALHLLLLPFLVAPSPPPATPAPLPPALRPPRPAAPSAPSHNHAPAAPIRA